MNPIQTEIAKSLFQLAWADGEVQQREVDVISAILERYGVPMAERLAAMDEALSDPNLEPPDLDAILGNHQSRLAVMERLVAVSFADGLPHPEEMKILAELAIRWGVSADELEMLRQKVVKG